MSCPAAWDGGTIGEDSRDEEYRALGVLGKNVHHGCIALTVWGRLIPTRELQHGTLGAPLHPPWV